MHAKTCFLKQFSTSFLISDTFPLSTNADDIIVNNNFNTVTNDLM